MSKMKKIFFYVDTFGLGHITREIALIRAMPKDVEISVFAGKYLDIIQKSLPGINVKKTNIGFRMVPTGIGLDVKKTIETNHDFEEHFNMGAEEEFKRLAMEKPDLVVADIPAEIFVAANRVNIPVVAVSNFGWTIIIEHIFGRKSREYLIYANAYSKATKTFVIPFNEPMESFPNKITVNLLRRKITKKLPKKTGILAAFGKSGMTDANEFYRLPDDEPEGQDHIAAAEMVFTKPAYGTVSEAASAGVPIFVRKREDFPESNYILKSLEWMGVVPEEVNPREWIKKEAKNIDWNAIKRMKEKYSKNGDEEIAITIRNML